MGGSSNQPWRRWALAFVVLGALSSLVAHRADTAVTARSTDVDAAAAGYTTRDFKVVRRPTVDELSEIYPERALRENIPGQAMVSCGVLANSGLENCFVVSEQPDGYDFGEAGLKAATDMLIEPPVRNGAPVENLRIQIPVGFRLPDGQTAGVPHPSPRTEATAAEGPAPARSPLALELSFELGGVLMVAMLTAALWPWRSRTET